MKKVSVIIPTYNSSKTIVRLLDSIYSQTGYKTHFELDVIVVDDCSSDNTVELVQEYELRLFSTSKNTGGPNTSRNIGLSKMEGECISIADHDDEWHHDKLLTQLPFLERVPIVSSGFMVVDSSTATNSIRGNSSNDNYLFFGENDTFKKRLIKSHSGQSTYLGSLLLDASLGSILFEETFGMLDYDYLLRLFHNKTSIEVTRPLYTRYVDGSNLSLVNSYRVKDYHFSLYFIERFRLHYPKEYRTACNRINGSRARYHYLMGEMKLARYYFIRSSFNLKTILYYLTTFYGSRYVKNKYNIFG